jgi:hypothetical protein
MEKVFIIVLKEGKVRKSAEITKIIVLSKVHELAETILVIQQSTKGREGHIIVL